MLVVFGSKSDERTYGKIDALLSQKSIPHRTVVCSAHRNPDELDELLRQKWEAVIAGAGLAAHLPGVAAARVPCPVIGVPCSGNYEGLDALLSIMQMPPGVPVLACPVDGAETAARAAEMVHKRPSSIHIEEGRERELESKAEATLAAMGVRCTRGSGRSGPNPNAEGANAEGAVTIRFVALEECGTATGSGWTIHCPSKQDSKAEDALLLKKIRGGLWVGLNRAENAAIAAAQIAGKTKEVTVYREAMRKR